MSNVKRGVLALLLLCSIAATGAACDYVGDREPVCHQVYKRYVKIWVPAPHVQAHLAHGDVLPDAYGDCP